MCGIRQVQSGHCDCGIGRKLLSRQENIEKLKRYQEDLEKELVAVKETLNELAEK